MRFISVSDARQWKFSELDKLCGNGVKLKSATKLFTEVATERGAIEALKGLSVCVNDLDTLELSIGNGIVNKEDGLYKMIEARVEMIVTDIKKQIIIAERYPEDYATEDLSCVNKILKYGDIGDKKLANAILGFASAGSKLNVNITNSMRNSLNKMLARIESLAINESDSELYNSSWAKKYFDSKANIMNVGLSEADKELLNAVKSVCENLEKHEIKNMEALRAISYGAFKHIYSIKYMGGKRAATQAEIESHVGNLFTVKVNMINNIDYYRVCTLLIMMTGEKNLRYNLSALGNEEDMKELGSEWFVTFKKDEATENMVSDNAKIMADRIKELNESLDSVIEGLKNGLKSIVYPTEIGINERYIMSANYTLDDMFDRILKEKKRNKYDEIAYKIVCECRKNKRYELSEKQLDLVTRTYNNLKSADASGVSVDAEECMRVATILKEQHSDKLNKTVTDIADKTIKSGICTIKQFEVLKTVLDEIERNKAFGGGSVKATDLIAPVIRDNGVAGTTKNVEEAESKNIGSNIIGGMAPMPVFTDKVDDECSVDDLVASLFGSGGV